MDKAFNMILERFDEECISQVDYPGYVIDLEKANEIVHEVAEEYKNGWIPCSERLPEIRQDCLVTVRYTGFMGMHGFWVKTGHMESENDWWGDCSGGEVIAWRPLPEPYKEYVEPPIDWSKVAVDTPILVRCSDNDDWNRRYFAKFKDGMVYAWNAGTTSWSTNNSLNALSWNQAKLAEMEETE